MQIWDEKLWFPPGMAIPIAFIRASASGGILALIFGMFMWVVISHRPALPCDANATSGTATAATRPIDAIVTLILIIHSPLRAPRPERFGLSIAECDTGQGSSAEACGSIE